MSRRRKQAFTIEHAILGMLDEQPRHGYDLYKRLLAPEALGTLWPLKQSQFYAMVAKLEQAGYLTSTQEAQDSYPPRKVLHLTDAGKAAFVAWFNSPASHGEDAQRELLARLYFAHRIGNEAVQHLVKRQHIATHACRDTLHAQLHALTDRSSFEYMVLQWRLHQVDTLLEWLGTCTAPPPLTSLVGYSIAPLCNTPRSTLAEQFVDYILSPQGQQTLVEHGLLAAGSVDTHRKPAVPTTPAADSEDGTTYVLTVFAAASLVDAFQVLGESFSAARRGVRVEYTFAGSHSLAQQIIAGAAVDVFASAHRAPMARVIQAGRIRASSERLCAYNRLAVATPRNNPSHLLNLCDLAKPGRRLVLGSDATAIGHYALELLEQVEQVGCLGSSGKLAVLQNVVGYEATPRAVLARVLAGEADAGIVFASDCYSAAGQVASPIIYPAATF